MASTKRKRAVVLALIAFFCGATAYVGVDWKRFGGGFLAFFKHKGDPVVATGGAAPSNSHVLPTSNEGRQSPGPNLSVAAANSHRHTSSVGGGSGGHKDDEDLFKYGDPAAGGIPAGSFVVAQNDAPGGGNGGAAPEAPSLGAPAVAEAAASPLSGGDSGAGGGGGVSSPAPAPGGSGGSGDSGIIVKSPTPAPSPAGTPASPTPAPSSPAPAPTQSGTGDQNNGGGDGGTDGDPTGGGTTPATPVPPVSSVPEASNAAMMGLGALFLAVAATRQRKGRQA
jgi:hypothetical protein